MFLCNAHLTSPPYSRDCVKTPVKAWLSAHESSSDSTGPGVQSLYGLWVAAGGLESVCCFNKNI